MVWACLAQLGSQGAKGSEEVARGVTARVKACGGLLSAFATTGKAELALLRAVQVRAGGRAGWTVQQSTQVVCAGLPLCGGGGVHVCVNVCFGFWVGGVVVGGGVMEGIGGWGFKCCSQLDPIAAMGSSVPLQELPRPHARRSNAMTAACRLPCS